MLFVDKLYKIYTHNTIKTYDYKIFITSYSVHCSFFTCVVFYMFNIYNVLFIYIFNYIIVIPIYIYILNIQFWKIVEFFFFLRLLSFCNFLNIIRSSQFAFRNDISKCYIKPSKSYYLFSDL